MKSCVAGRCLLLPTRGWTWHQAFVPALFAAGAAVTLLGSGACAVSDEPAGSDVRVAELERAVATDRTNAGLSSLGCGPTDLTPDDTLALSLPRSHGPYLAVQAPDSTMYFIVFPADGGVGSGAALSLMPADSFVSLESLRLPVRDLRAVPWVFGRDTAEAVFDRAGLYRVLVAYDLETDAPVIEQCSVRYSGGRTAN